MKYIDLDNQIKDGTTGQDRLLEKLFSHSLGRVLMKLLSLPLFTYAGGALISSPLSKPFIRSFIRKNQISMEAYPAETYRSFNDFFIRSILPEKRPIDPNPANVISPADGFVSAYPIGKDSVFPIKGVPYSTRDLLLGDEKKISDSERRKRRALAAHFTGGTVVIVRLTPVNYHRYHFPFSCRVEDSYGIPGIFHTVNPVIHEFQPVYRENSRVVSVLTHENGASAAMIEVGALMVGKVCNHPVTAGNKGDEKGYFAFGGSSIALIFDSHVKIQSQFLKNTENGYETEILMGMKIAEFS